MLKGEKILITGPAGRIAFDIARKLAPDNEVWGIARFSNHDQRAEVEALLGWWSMMREREPME